MKYSKTLSLLLMLVFSVSLCFGCAARKVAVSPLPLPTVDASQTPEAETVVDMAGREIMLGAAPERIVILSAADCEILYALGAGDKLVGRGEYCNYPEAVLSVEAVESGSEANIERILALKPQAVVMSMMAQTREQVATLEAAGITVIVNNANDIDGTYTAIELMGKLVKKTEAAQTLINDMRSAFTEINSQAALKNTSKPEPKTVYFEVSPLQYGLWTAGSGTFMNEIANILGLKNIFEDVVGWGEISEEQVIDRDPDYIVTITPYYGEGVTPVDEIKSRTGWQSINAVKNNAIYNADSDEFSRPSPRLLDAARSLYSFVYGE